MHALYLLDNIIIIIFYSVQYTYKKYLFVRNIPHISKNNPIWEIFNERFKRNTLLTLTSVF